MSNSRSETPVLFENQDPDAIRAAYKRSGQLFEDPVFVAEDQSLFFSRAPPRPFVWKRPSELCSDPKLFVGGAGRLDVVQGMLGDDWLLAGISSLAGYESLLHRVVPREQSFSGEYYCGMFEFCFWLYGKWTRVVVDDLLPTYNNKLVFVHSPEKNEFWTALLEKAYAKLMGSYEALKGGSTAEALTDFTGGVVEEIDTTKPPKNAFRILLKAVARQSLMCCSISARPEEIEAKMSNGLIKGHTYTVTSATMGEVRTSRREGAVMLVRVRNPWANEREWTGAWSDRSSEWSLMSDDDKKKLGVTFDDDGEFWMSFSDFMANFTNVTICSLSPDSAVNGSRTKSWTARTEQGEWRRSLSAGGCRNFPATFHTNPQYRVKLVDPDDDDEEDNCTIVVALMQKGRRRQKRVGAQNLTIGFAIYKLEDDHNGDDVEKDFFLYNQSTARSHSFLNSREITGRFSLPPGEYVIMPSTFKPNEQGQFILRLITEKAPSEQTSTQLEYKKPTQQSTEEHSKLNARFSETFNRIAGDDGQVDAFELQTILTAAYKRELGNKDFSLEVCRSLIAATDTDVEGKLDMLEFNNVVVDLRHIRGTFSKYDADRSGSMDTFELRNALREVGISVRHATLARMVTRFANKVGQLSLDDFIRCVYLVRTVAETSTKLSVHVDKLLTMALSI